MKTISKSPKKKQQSILQNKASSENLVISELNMQNNKSDYFGQTIIPKKGHQIDNYQGPVDPETRLRHGFGTYRYPNKFFTYIGNYNQGVKEGEGTLKFADGTLIKGTFSNNQLIGQAEISYADGSTYKGNLKNGQKSGYGIHKTKLQSYQGQYLQNKRHGQGLYQNGTTTIKGTFKDNKPDGQNIQISKYNYLYIGGCQNGLKSGKGIQTSYYLDNSYKYEGSFKNDKFQGEGIYENKSKIGYKYSGQFKQGQPSLYPNEFKILLGTSTGLQSQKPSIQAFTFMNSEQSLATPIQYELQTQNKLYFQIQCCYQGPEQLDPNQPTQQQIQKMIKDWQNQNKKNKNPPPMPDFRKPRKIKPALVLVSQQSDRPIHIRLAKLQGNDTGAFLKIDYRQNMKKKRQQNDIIKAQAAKKAQQEGNKKGGKGANKAQPELKVNCFVQNPTQKQKSIQILNKQGRSRIQKLQFPDDFPPGNYQFVFSSPFQLFGTIKEVKKNVIIKPKNTGGKKK